MSALSEVTCVFAERAAELERARELFITEIRAFTDSVLSGLRARSAYNWISPRVRLDVPSDILFDHKTTGYLRTQYAHAAVTVRFKKGAHYQAVADVTFGIEYVDSPEQESFAWAIKLVPFSRYLQLDDALWHAWKQHRGKSLPPGAMHEERANVVRFVVRPLSPSLTGALALEDVQEVLEFMLRADEAFVSACGVDPVGEDVR